VCNLSHRLAKRGVARKNYAAPRFVYGSLIPPGPDTVLDSSSNGNHMQTFDPSFTSATYSSLVSPLPLRSGLPNTRSLDFGEGGDGPGRNDDNFTTSAKPVSGQLFNAMTVEVAFRMHSVNDFATSYQAIVGKDGKPLGDGDLRRSIVRMRSISVGDPVSSFTNPPALARWAWRALPAARGCCDARPSGTASSIEDV